MDIKKDLKEEVVISEEVIAKIASTAALDVPGVASMVNKPVDIKKVFERNKGTKSVYVVNNENQTEVDIYLSLKSGVRIADVVEQIQKHVKDEVQNMTSKVVNKVNVHVCEIDLEKEEKAE